MMSPVTRTAIFAIFPNGEIEASWRRVCISPAPHAQRDGRHLPPVLTTPLGGYDGVE